MHLPIVNGLSAPRAALAYVEAGIPIVPFDPKRGNGKECGNLVGGQQKWYRLCTTDKSQLRAWRERFGRFEALATSPGEIGCLVIDLDHPELWPAKWRKYLKDKSVPYVNTRPNVHKRKGHYWFSTPTASTMSNRSFVWGEIRCVGRGLVLPPYQGRTVVREGVPPNLPDDLRANFAGAVGVGELTNLAEFLSRHSDETRPYKLKGLQTIFDRKCIPSRHNAAREALLVGFGESRLGYVTAHHVYDSIRWRWNKTAREFYQLARWCASVAESMDLDELKAKSDRGCGTDSREVKRYWEARAAAKRGVGCAELS